MEAGFLAAQPLSRSSGMMSTPFRRFSRYAPLFGYLIDEGHIILEGGNNPNPCQFDAEM
jgi:hypothetical protein